MKTYLILFFVVILTISFFVFYKYKQRDEAVFSATDSNKNNMTSESKVVSPYIVSKATPEGGDKVEVEEPVIKGFTNQEPQVQGVSQ